MRGRCVEHSSNCHARSSMSFGRGTSNDCVKSLESLGDHSCDKNFCNDSWKMGLPQDFGIEEKMNVDHAAYPVQMKEASGKVGGIPTDIKATFFSDNILLTISQAGKLGQWVRRD